MKAVLDACVLYPTVLRELLLAVARAGLFEPVWSARLLGEWERVAHRAGARERALATGDMALMRAEWPGALVSPAPQTESALWLPDAADRHVLATAIEAGAPVIVTFNLKDFPKRALFEHGVTAEHPDAFLHGLFVEAPERVFAAVEAVRAQAEALSGEAQPVRRLLKKAGLPRLGKALEGWER